MSRSITLVGLILEVSEVCARVILCHLFLFNLAADSLNHLISRAQDAGRLIGLVPHLISKGLSVLQYANDTILFIQDDMAQAVHMKLILYMFEAMTGLKIDKSEVLMILDDGAKSLLFADLFGCQLGTWPIKYLFVPVCGSRLYVIDWDFLIERLMKNPDGWIGMVLSLGGRLILINSSLSSVPIYHMSMFLLHDTILEKMNKIIRRFFWQCGSSKKKYDMVKWALICKPKDKGGLGIKNLKIFNACLL